MSESLLSRMIAAGVPADLIADVARLEARAQMVEEALECRRSSDRSRKQRERGRVSSRDVTGQGVTSAETRDSTPLDKKGPQTPKELNPPTPTNDAEASFVPPAGVEPGDDEDRGSAGARPPRQRKASKRPVAKRKTGSRLKLDWEAPAVEDLSLEVQAVLRQWPAGAYQMTALQFRNHFASESRAIGAKRDWGRTWENWLIRESAQVMRAARNGVDFTGALRSVASPAAVAKARQAVAEVVERQAGEGGAVAAIRAAMRRQCGEQAYESWLSPTLIDLEADTLTIRAGGKFHLDYVERTLGEKLERIASAEVGRTIYIRWELLKPPDRVAA